MIMKRLFLDVKRDYLANIDVKPNSKKVYSLILDLFVKWVVRTGRNIKELTRADILAYKSYLIESNKSENTIDLYLAAVRTFYEYAEALGEHDNIALNIKLHHKSNTYKKDHLQKEEIDALLRSIDRTSIIGRRDFAIINLMLRSGMRCVEVSNLRLCDITTRKDGADLLLLRKGDEVRYQRIGLTRKAIDPILDYIDDRCTTDISDWVFVTHCQAGEHQMTPALIGRIVKSYMIKAGVYSKMKTAHSLRHTAAVMALLHKVPIKEVQLMLGHKRIETTETYLRSIEREIRLDNPAARALDNVF